MKIQSGVRDKWIYGLTEICRFAGTVFEDYFVLNVFYDNLAVILVEVASAIHYWFITRLVKIVTLGHTSVDPIRKKANLTLYRSF